MVILDGDHDLLETLPFSSALPYRSASSSRYEVEGLIWDQSSSLVGVSDWYKLHRLRKLIYSL